MTITMTGIGEGIFAFFILFCTLIGMLTGAYLMDRNRLIQNFRDLFFRVRKGCLRYAKKMMEKGTW